MIFSTISTFDDFGRITTVQTPIERIGNTTHYNFTHFEYDLNGNLVRERVSTHAMGAAENFAQTK